MLVTAHTSPDIAAVLLRLKEAGRRVALISLSAEPLPALPGIISYHVPPGIPAPPVAPPTGLDSRALSEASLARVPVPEPLYDGPEVEGP